MKRIICCLLLLILAPTSPAKAQTKPDPSLLEEIKPIKATDNMHT